MKTSQNILYFLETHGPSTVAELSIALERTKADIREQMDQLLAQNRVERLVANRLDAPGRPAARFGLIQKTPEPLVKGLISGLMGFLNVNDLNQEKEVVFIELITNTLMANFNPQSISSASRLNQAVVYLESIGVKTSWVATQKGPKITLLHENISDLIRTPALSKKVIRQLILKMKEKAVGA
jgi:predicted ArsR family transcriptional regulator